jgi:uncharacterized membrane-anchored protein YhcB (DUF1043 family)
MMDWLSWGIAFASLCLVIGGSIFSFGRNQGKTNQKVEKHSEDINNLWDHQRLQDVNISEIKEAIPRIDTNIKWIMDDMKRRGTK